MTIPDVDDAQAAASVVAQVPGLTHRQRPMPPHVLPYSELDQLPPLDEPGALAASSACERWWHSHIASLGPDVHLGGDGGDAVMTAPLLYLADLAHLRAAGQLWRHAVGWAQLRNQAPHLLIRTARSARQANYRSELGALAAQLRAGSLPAARPMAALSLLPHTAVAAWMSRQGRELVAERLHQHAAEHAEPVVPGSFGIGDTAAWLTLTAFGRQQRLDADLAATQGINHQSPFLDDAVIRACWSIPAWHRTTPHQAKPLLVNAFTNLVPASVLRRSTKGDHTAYAYRGLATNAPELTRLFTDSCLAQVGLIEDSAVRAVISRARAGQAIPLGALDLLVTTELWLRGNSGTHDSAGRDTS